MPPKLAPTSNAPSRKRKESPSQQHPRPQKRSKWSDARNVEAQKPDHAYKNGELDVAKFVQARQFEIRALEKSIHAAHGMRNSRAFQQVPWDLRRRTASHNAKKVPKRLRRRAAREMADDNTPTVTRRRREPTPHLRLRLENVKKLKELAAKARRRKEKRRSEDEMEITVTPHAEGTGDPCVVQSRTPRVKKNALKNPDKPPAKFRKRQINKTWLPTHVYHAKRAHMTPPTAPLWRFALPLTPTAKGYRPTHRASTIRGAVAWDMSYVSTIGLEGPEKSIEGVLKALGVGCGDTQTSAWGRLGQRWRDGTRAWTGWLYEREQYPRGALAPVTIMWCSQMNEHPVANSDACVAPPSKKPKRRVFVRVHPSAFQAAWGEIIRLAKVQKPAVIVEDLRFEIGSIEVVGPQATEALVAVLRPTCADEDVAKQASPAATVWGVLGPITNPASLPPNVMLAFEVADPRLHYPPRPLLTTGASKDPAAHVNLLKYCAEWPLDEVRQPQTLFDRDTRLAATRCLRSQKGVNRRKSLAGMGKDPEALPTDPRIPVLIYTTRGSEHECRWTVLLPWKCVAPVWRSLMYYPISTGQQVRLGGLREQQQIAFEAGRPYFPSDYPGTQAGDAWEQLERAGREAEWKRRPKGKRTEWESVPLGIGQKGEVGRDWACDWEYLFRDTIASLDFPRHVPSSVGRSALASLQEPATAAASEGLVTVKVSLTTKGTPQACARIYRLPTGDDGLRQQWLDLHSKPGSQRQRKSLPCRLPPDTPVDVRNAQLARSLLEPSPCQPGAPDYPPVPPEVDLIGYVTTGNFNLGHGKSIGIGSLRLSKVLPEPGKSGLAEHNRLCIVRNAGQVVGRLARWELV